MIKDYKVTKVPSVELGNLGLHNCSSYYVVKDLKHYPMAWFGKDTEDGGEEIAYFPGKPGDCPRGMEIREQYDTPYESLIDYALMIKSEHSDLTDKQMDKQSRYHGYKRSMRWDDERRRRGLLK